MSFLAVVGVFFLARSALNLQRLNDPLSVLGFGIGGPVGIVALGVREYRRGQRHDAHDHESAGNNG